MYKGNFYLYLIKVFFIILSVNIKFVDKKKYKLNRISLKKSVRASIWAWPTVLGHSNR